MNVFLVQAGPVSGRVLRTLPASLLQWIRARGAAASGWRGYGTGAQRVSPSSDELREKFKALEIKRVLVLEKITKYDVERRNGLSDDEILHRFPLAYKTHQIHRGIMEAMVRQLTERYRVHTIVVKAQSHNMSLIDVERSAFPPDIVISAGGDGTFLEAAALVPPTQPPRKQLWIVGLNTDPERSVGALCLSYFKRGDTVFRRYTAAAGEGASGGPGLPPKQNMIRFTGPGPESLVRKECTSDTTGAREWDAIVNASFNEAPAGACRDAPDQCTVISKNTANIYNLTYDEYVGHLLERLIVRRDCEPVARQKIRIKMCKRHGGMEREIANVKVDSTHIEDTLFCGADSDFSGEELETEIRSSRCGLVPCSAVNDVIVADESFGRTFYGLMQVDSSPVMRVKSSGVLVSTGTGSTAWAYNMCKQTMHNGFMLFNSLLSHPSLPREVADRVDAKMMREAIEAHNASLVFAASENTMKCIIREAISTTSTVDSSSFMGRQVKLLSLSKNARLFIDGSKVMKVGYGDVVVLKTFDSDTIWSCV